MNDFKGEASFQTEPSLHIFTIYQSCGGVTHPKIIVKVDSGFTSACSRAVSSSRTGNVTDQLSLDLIEGIFYRTPMDTSIFDG